MSNNFSLNFVGNGSAFSSHRGNNCAYFKEDRKILFLDFGEDIFDRVSQSKLLDDVDEVYVAITHLHSDHIGSLPTLIPYNHYKKNIPTYFVLNDVDDAKDGLFEDYLYITGADEFYKTCDSQLNNAFKSIKKLEFTKVSHLSEHDFAIKIQFNNGKIIYYSGDTNDEKYIASVVSNLGKNDEFYCDTCLADYEGNVHTNIEVLNRLVPQELHGQVVCMHYDSDDLIELVEKYGFVNSDVLLKK